MHSQNDDDHDDDDDDENDVDDASNSDGSNDVKHAAEYFLWGLWIHLGGQRYNGVPMSFPMVIHLNQFHHYCRKYYVMRLHFVDCSAVTAMQAAAIVAE